MLSDTGAFGSVVAASLLSDVLEEVLDELLEVPLFDVVVPPLLLQAETRRTSANTLAMNNMTCLRFILVSPFTLS